MNKTELIEAMAAKCELSKKDTEKAVSAVIESIIESVKKGEKVQLIGFGTFELRARAARTGRDPRTNKPISIPACNVPAFKAGKAFKDEVSGK